MKNVAAFKKAFYLICLPFLLVVLSGPPIKYLSGIAETSGMVAYADKMKVLRENGKLSGDTKESLKSQEKAYLEEIGSSGYAKKKLYVDYFYVPLLVLFFSVAWFFLGRVTASHKLGMIVGLAFLYVFLLIFYGYSYQPYVHAIAFICGVLIPSRKSRDNAFDG